MIGYSATKVFPEAAQIVRDRAEQIVLAVPEHMQIRCHELARVVANVLAHPRISVIDGKYGPPYPRRDLDPHVDKIAHCVGPKVEHSWLTLFSAVPRPTMFVLDVYAVGRLPIVQLVEVGMGLGAMYHPADVYRNDIDRARVTELSRYLKEVEGLGWRWDY